MTRVQLIRLVLDLLAARFAGGAVPDEARAVASELLAELLDGDAYLAADVRLQVQERLHVALKGVGA